MPLFIVGFDLGISKDYRALWHELEKLDAFMVLESVYLFDIHDITAVELRDQLKGFVDQNDGLIVVEFLKRPAAYKCKFGTKNWLSTKFE